MEWDWLSVISIMFCLAAILPYAGCAEKSAAEEETEILKSTVGEPTKLSDLVNQNTASVMVSRTYGLAFGTEFGMYGSFE